MNHRSESCEIVPLLLVITMQIKSETRAWQTIILSTCQLSWMACIAFLQKFQVNAWCVWIAIRVCRVDGGCMRENWVSVVFALLSACIHIVGCSLHALSHCVYAHAACNRCIFICTFAAITRDYYTLVYCTPLLLRKWALEQRINDDCAVLFPLLPRCYSHYENAQTSFVHRVHLTHIALGNDQNWFKSTLENPNGIKYP